MSLYGMMRTGGSGMNAQANRLGTVADNIANASTTGYKRSSTEFSSLILPTTGGNYNSGGVETKVRQSISEAGSLNFTTSGSDLAIKGSGFFVVAGATGTNYLTRAGAFTQDKDGNLVNTAGYALQGYRYVDGAEPSAVGNSFDGLSTVNLAAGGVIAKGSTKGSMGADLDSSLPIGGQSKTSLSVYDTQGNVRILDFLYSKTAANTWTLDVSDRDPVAVLGSINLDFDAAGKLTTTPTTFTTAEIANLPVTGATLSELTIDVGATKQVGTKFSANGGSSDGAAPSKIVGYEIDDKGIVFVRYANNTLDPRFRIAIADVQSPDNLVAQSGNVYSPGAESGIVNMGVPGNGQFGSIQSGALEGSNVDIANELTSMIESQRSYTANSKVFQTGSDLLDVLVNLKR